MGKQLVAEYEVKPDKLGECLEAIRTFVNAIQADEPGVVRYEAYRCGESLEFIHFMEFASDEAEQSHRVAPHTKQFVDILYPNCRQTPVFTELSPIL